MGRLPKSKKLWKGFQEGCTVSCSNFRIVILAAVQKWNAVGQGQMKRTWY